MTLQMIHQFADFERNALPALGSSVWIKSKCRFPVCFLTQGQVCLEGLALFGDEAFEQAGLALRAKRLDLFWREGLLRNGFVEAEVAALPVAAATVEVLPIGLLDGSLLAFRAQERSERRLSSGLGRRCTIRG